MLKARYKWAQWQNSLILLYTSVLAARLTSHVQTEEFGSSLDAEFDKVFKQTLLENLPVKLSALHRTAVRQALEDSGRTVETDDEGGPGPSKKSKTGPSGQILLIDQSHVLIKQLLFDPLPDPALPTNDSEMSQWLFGFTKLTSDRVISSACRHHCTGASDPSG
ncbi:TPA: hypothetical protein ACH3X3_014954 [Trebouxia sp. C0006]